MAKKMFLDIQMFAQEGGNGGGITSLWVNAANYNPPISAINGQIENLNQIFSDNKGTFERLKAVAGAPKLDDDLKDNINYLINVIDSTSRYIDSFADWSSSANTLLYPYTDDNLATIDSFVNKVMFDSPGENFQDGNKGIKSIDDVDDFNSDVTNIVAKLGEVLHEIPRDVAQAETGICPELINTLHGTISVNDKTVNDNYAEASRICQEELNNYKEGLYKAFVSLNDGAAGGN